MAATPPTIELHTHTRGVIQLTDWCTSVSWSHAVAQPWGKISLTLQVPRSQQREVWPRHGDWIVVRDGVTRDALAFGYVKRRGGGITASGPAGAIVSRPTTVEAVPWLAVLGSLELYVLSQLGATRFGGVMGLEAWEGGLDALLSVADTKRLMPTIAKQTGSQLASRLGDLDPFQDQPREALASVPALPSYQRRDIGESLREILPHLAAIVLPKSLGEEELGHAVSVVHDPTTATAFAANRSAEAVPGWGVPGMHAVRPVGATALSIIMGTFGADPNMVELFASLEAPGVPSQASPLGLEAQVRDELRKKRQAETVGATAGANLAGTAATSTDLAASLRDLLEPSELEVAQERERRLQALRSQPAGAAFSSKLGSALGRNPVLVYRMRPWRTMPLSRWVRDRMNIFREDGSHRWNVSATDLDLTLFEQPTWNIDRATRVVADRVTEVSYSSSEDDSVTLVTMGLPTDPQSEIRFLKEAGLPIFGGNQLWTRGCRMFQPQWPFMPPEASDIADIITGIRTIALQAHQFMYANERFESGTIVIKGFSPEVRHGEPLRVGMPAGAPGPELTCYVEEVTHQFSVVGSAIHSTTTVSYSRGLFDESARSDPRLGVGGVRTAREDAEMGDFNLRRPAWNIG
jgi:hypothetical protein